MINPEHHEEQKPETNEVLPIPALLATPYEGDDFVTYARRLAGQVESMSVELRWDKAIDAKDLVLEHYREHIGRLLFATTYLAISAGHIAEGDPEQSLAAYAFHNASVSGTVSNMNVLSLSNESHLVAIELEDATVYHTNPDTNERLTYESPMPVIVPIAAMTSHELL